MNDNLKKYSEELLIVFGNVIDILSRSRSLVNVSQELKFLAMNGIIQASKISSKKGQSLITLSGFLAELPNLIKPELNNLEFLAYKLSRLVTICSMNVKRMLQYSGTLMKFYKQTNSRIIASQMMGIDFLNSKEFYNTTNNIRNHLNGTLDIDRAATISSKIIGLQGNIGDTLLEAKTTMLSVKNTIIGIRRYGMIANYMRSYLSIESAYLSVGQNNFSGLINNIKVVFDVLDERLKTIEDIVYDGEVHISNLTKRG